jgi:hypothetical protein
MTTERWEDQVDVIDEDIWPNIAYNYKSIQHKEKEQQTSGNKLLRLELGSVTNNTSKNFKLQN